MANKTYQVWDSSESIETSVPIEAETPCQAAFFAANERKPRAIAEFIVAFGDERIIVVVEPQTTYQVREREPPEVSPGAA